MNCNEAEKLIHNLIDEEVSPDQCAELKEHILYCNSCSEYYSGLKAQNKLLRDIYYPKTDEALIKESIDKADKIKRSRFLSVCLPCAAGFVAMAISAAVIFSGAFGNNNANKVLLSESAAGTEESAEGDNGSSFLTGSPEYAVEYEAAAPAAPMADDCISAAEEEPVAEEPAADKPAEEVPTAEEAADSSENNNDFSAKSYSEYAPEPTDIPSTKGGGIIEILPVCSGNMTEDELEAFIADVNDVPFFVSASKASFLLSVGDALSVDIKNVTSSANRDINKDIVSCKTDGLSGIAEFDFSALSHGKYIILAEAVKNSGMIDYYYFGIEIK